MNKQLFARIISSLIPIKRYRRFVRDYYAFGGSSLRSPEGGLRLYYYPRTNFGDALNEDFMRFCGVKFRPSPVFFADYSCIGSLLENFLEDKRSVSTPRPLHVFGSGFGQPPASAEERFFRPLIIHALRGALSRERCERATGQDLSAVPLGDPALLLPRIFPNARASHSDKVGIVCHLTDRGKAVFNNIRLEHTPFTYIDIASEPAQFVKELTSCGFILSSALHPLISADAFGIPNRHIVTDDHFQGGNYKFRDYYSAYENADDEPLRLDRCTITDADIERMRAETPNRGAEAAAIAERLLGAMPAELRPQ